MQPRYTLPHISSIRIGTHYRHTDATQARKKETEKIEILGILTLA